MVEFRLVSQAQDAERFEQAQRADAVGVRCIFGNLEAHLHMALRRKIVNLVGLRFPDNSNEIGRIGQVTIMHEEARVAFVGIDIEVIDPARVERRAALDAMDDIILLQK